MSTKPATLTALRAQLKAADPYRPGISRMKREEMEFLLQHIAEGGAIFPHPDHVEPIGSVRFDDIPADGFYPADAPITRATSGAAHKARGTVSMNLSDAWVAGFLAATN